jgi:hypothetical protein
MHYARTSRKTSNRAPGGKGKGTRPYHQRCAVRVTYLKNKTGGLWRAHGRYLARETATLDKDAKAGGFDRENDDVDIANLSKSGVGASVGRTGLRVGMDAKRRKYFSVGVPGTGLSYRTIFGRPVAVATLKKVGYVVIVTAICLGVAVILSVQKS